MSASPLRIAIRNRDCSTVERLLSKDPSSADLIESGLSNLYVAACWNCVDIGEALIERNCNLNFSNSELITPLLLSIKCRHYEFATMLIEAGANLNIRSRAGESSLSLAVAHSEEELCRLLILRGASLADRNDAYGEEAPLSIAAKIGNTSIMQMLLNANAPAGNVSTLRLERLRPDACQRWIAKFPCLNALQLQDCGIPPSLSLLCLDSLFLVNCGVDFDSPFSHALFGRKLREIDLSSNGLRRIPLSFFESVPNLEKLNLSSNLLSSLAPLSLLQNLKHLDLSHNQFQYAPATVIDRRPWLWSILQSNSCIVNPTEDLIASPAPPVITVPSLKALSATIVAQEALQSTFAQLCDSNTCVQFKSEYRI